MFSLDRKNKDGLTNSVSMTLRDLMPKNILTEPLPNLREQWNELIMKCRRSIVANMDEQNRNIILPHIKYENVTGTDKFSYFSNEVTFELPGKDNFGVQVRLHFCAFDAVVDTISYKKDDVIITFIDKNGYTRKSLFEAGLKSFIPYKHGSVKESDLK